MVEFLPVISAFLPSGKGQLGRFCGFYAAQSRGARLAGFGFPNDCRGLCFMLSGETELGNAEEQPNKG